jgi:hypothetical protein
VRSFRDLAYWRIRDRSRSSGREIKSKISLLITLALISQICSITTSPISQAVVQTPYNSQTGNGDVACRTNNADTGFFRVSDFRVIGNKDCVGAVVIPESVTAIASSAFDAHPSDGSAGQQNYLGSTIPSNISSLTLPTTLASIGSFAFRNIQITTLTIPNNVTSLDIFAFVGASNLETLTISNGITTIPAYAFAGLINLKSLTLPNNLTTIGDRAFEGLNSLPTINIPNSVTSMGSYAFNGLYSITSLTIPNRLTSIPDYAFYDAHNLTSLVIPDSVTSVGSQAFYGMSNIRSLTLPNSITSIGSESFRGMSNITTLNLSNHLTTIGDWAFSGMSQITSLTIPSSVTTIGNQVFSGMTNIASLVIPNSVITIGGGAFFAMTNISSLTIGSNVTEIGNGAFQGMAYLTSLTIPDSVTVIGGSAFQDAYSLTSINIGTRVVNIGARAFLSAQSVREIVIPNSVTNIGDGAFQYMSALETLTIGSGVTTIGDEAFAANPALKEIVIPDSVISIGYWAFGYDSGVTSIKIGKGLSAIPGYTFWGAASLTSLTIPNSVTTIGERAFKAPSPGDNGYAKPSELTTLTIPSSVTSLGEQSFTGLTALSTLNYCGSLTSSDFTTAGLGSFYVGRSCSVTDPGAPTGVTATITGAGAARVAFIAPTDNGGASISAYTATASPGNIKRTVYQSGSGSISFSGLESSTAYSFTVTASNWGKTSSPSLTSNTVTTPGVPGAPTGVSASLSGTSAVITYSAPLNNGGVPITSYLASSIDGLHTASVTRSGGGTITVTGLSGGQTYQFTVIARNTVGDSVPSGSVSITVPATVPDPPTGVEVFVNAQGEASVSFPAPINDGGAEITSYTATSTPGGLTGTLAGSSGGTITLTGLSRGVFYQFTVVATNSVGNSMPSEPTTAVDVPLGPPGNPRAVNVSLSADSTTATITFTEPLSDGGSPITSYTAYASNDDAMSTIQEADCCTITVSGLTPGTINGFYLFASNTNGNSDGILTDFVGISFDGINGAKRCGTSGYIVINEKRVIDYVQCRGSVEIPTGVEVVTGEALCCTYRITSVTFPETLRSIEAYAFVEDTGINSLILPEGLTSIGVGAFQFLSNLTSLRIPSSVTSLGENAFANAESLTSFQYCGGSLVRADFDFAGLAGITMLPCSSEAPTAPTSRSESVTIPSPRQQSKISEISVESTKANTKTPVIITGNFFEEVLNISISDIFIPRSDWVQTSGKISVTLPALRSGKYVIQLYNGSAPVLKALNFTVEAAATPLPVQTKSPRPARTPRPLATPTPNPLPATPAKTPSKSKTTTIKCVKGKVVKTIKGTKPKCPTGFVKK